MFNPFKNWLGIEGVKIELLIPEEVKATDGFIDGRVIFHSKQLQLVEHLEIKLVEKYTRGKEESTKINEYELGKITRESPIEVRAFENVHIDFALPFQLLQSDVDEWGSKNIISQKISQVFKNIHQVRSEYKVVATAHIKGTALNPFQEKSIEISV